ncbi:MAG: hypothetical protein IPG45_01455 [Deltaproteobacteria bacterium]|nr:hypothetical protein [Deltaproteobacteria bacterium]
MRCPFGLGFFVWLVPACALSFEPLGLSGGDASGGVDATQQDSGRVGDLGTEPGDGGEDRDVVQVDTSDSGPGDADLGNIDSGIEVVIELGMSGANDAWFHSQPTGLECLSSGRFSVPYATVWEVEAMPSPTRVFNRWTRGPCNTSTVSVCRFTADQDLTLRADYNPH